MNNNLTDDVRLLMPTADCDKHETRIIKVLSTSNIAFFAFPADGTIPCRCRPTVPNERTPPNIVHLRHFLFCYTFFATSTRKTDDFVEFCLKAAFEGGCYQLLNFPFCSYVHFVTNNHCRVMVLTFPTDQHGHFTRRSTSTLCFVKWRGLSNHSWGNPRYKHLHLSNYTRFNFFTHKKVARCC